MLNNLIFGVFFYFFLFWYDKNEVHLYSNKKKGIKSVSPSTSSNIIIKL